MFLQLRANQPSVGEIICFHKVLIGINNRLCNIKEILYQRSHFCIPNLLWLTTVMHTKSKSYLEFFSFSFLFLQSFSCDSTLNIIKLIKVMSVKLIMKICHSLEEAVFTREQCLICDPFILAPVLYTCSFKPSLSRIWFGLSSITPSLPSTNTHPPTPPLVLFFSYCT